MIQDIMELVATMGGLVFIMKRMDAFGFSASVNGKWAPRIPWTSEKMQLFAEL